LREAIVQGIKKVPEEITNMINVHRYREAFHMSYQDFENEPGEIVEQTFLIWRLEHERDKLDSYRRNQKNGNHG
jgi:hypothetical protein